MLATAATHLGSPSCVLSFQPEFLPVVLLLLVGWVFNLSQNI